MQTADPKGFLYVLLFDWQIADTALAVPYSPSQALTAPNILLKQSEAFLNHETSLLPALGLPQGPPPLFPGALGCISAPL